MMKTTAATISNRCITPPPIFSKNPNNQKNTTIPPSHLKNLISSTPFFTIFYISVVLVYNVSDSLRLIIMSKSLTIPQANAA